MHKYIMFDRTTFLKLIVTALICYICLFKSLLFVKIQLQNSNDEDTPYNTVENILTQRLTFSSFSTIFIFTKDTGFRSLLLLFSAPGISSATYLHSTDPFRSLHRLDAVQRREENSSATQPFSAKCLSMLIVEQPIIYLSFTNICIRKEPLLQFHLKATRGGATEIVLYASICDSATGLEDRVLFFSSYYKKID